MNKGVPRSKTIYIGLVFILVIQAFLTTIGTISVKGEEKNEEPLTLTSAHAKTDEIHLQVAVNNISEKKTFTIKYDTKVEIEKANWETSSNQTPLTLDKANHTLTISAAKNTDFQDAIVLKVTKRPTIDETVKFSYNEQNISTIFTAAKDDKNTSNKVKDITGKTGSTEKNKDIQPKTKTPTVKKTSKAKAAAGTDIRTYFPEGNGTIITDANLVYLDKDGNVLREPIPADATVRAYYNWKIPEDIRAQIKSGDYFNFKLPDELKPLKPVQGDLKNEDGEIYAHYTVDADGNVQFVFNENVTNESDIIGSFNFDTEFDKTTIPGPGDQTIHYPEGDNLPPVDVIIKPTTDKQIDKKGEFDRTPNPTAIKWTVDFNQAMNKMTNPKITENWPDNVNYESVKVYKLVMNLDGTVKEVGEELDPNEYTVDANGNIAINGETSEAYRAVYETKIDDAAIPENGGNVTFVNTATLSDDEQPDGIDAKATVTNQYGKMLEKKQTGYDPDNQTFSWTVKYNYGEKNIPENQATITDTMSDNMDLVDSSIKINTITFDEKGKEIEGDALVGGEDYELTPTADGKFKIHFLHDIKTALKVNYQTKVNGIVTDPVAVNNKVDTDTGETSNDGGTANQQNIIKKLGDVDYANELSKWTLSVNKNRYEMNDLVINDSYHPSPGLNMNTVDGHYDFTIKDVTDNTSLQEGVDYDIEIVKDTEGNETGFQVVYKGGYLNTDHEFAISYQTHFDISLLDPDNLDLDKFTNGASIDWTDSSNNKHHSSDEADFKPDYSYSLNASKSGEYNAQTKEITWTIAVNLSGNELQDAFLKDKIIDNQSYVDGSLSVYKGKTQSNGSVIKDGDSQVNDQMKDITTPSSANDQTFNINFPDGVDQTYIVEFKTSLADQVIEKPSAYDNTADYSNQGDDRDVKGEVSVKNGGSFIQKDGEQSEDDPNYVNWHLTINPSQSTLDNVVVTDTPSENQVIDKDSIKLYETNIAEDGTVTPDTTKPLTLNKDYTVELTTDNETGKQELVVKMIGQIKTAYYMSYQSFIASDTAGREDTLSNDADITGDGSKTIHGADTEEVTVEVDHSGGNANGKKGSITIKKTKNNTTQPLTGATFQIWDTAKTQVLREGEVDENGQIKFGGLPQGDYLLIESNAPDGYVIADDLANGRKITINDKTSLEDSNYVVPNEMNELLVTKSNDNDKKLSGAQFKVERLNTLALNGWEDIPLITDVTDSNGLLKVEGLKAGLYRLTEVKAPAGYLLSTTPQYFIVSKNGTVSENKTIRLSKVDYQGTATLTKKDAAGDTLAGAVFKVVNEEGETVKTNLRSNSAGIVTANDLAPGKYRFVETEAPEGYILNTTSVPFEIADSASGKPAVVDASDNFINYQGSAILTKVNKADDPLVGAVFKVVDAQDRDVQTNLRSDEDGKVKVQNLMPGSYKFVETKAPEGYLLNTERASFTIPDEQNGEATPVSVGKYVNYKASFKLEKVDTSGNDLNGAEFTLYNAEKEKMNITKTSTADGIVEFDDLAPGVYFFKETKAPKLADGSEYVINPELHKVVISDRANGEPETINIGDFQNFKGRAEVTKVGDGGSIAGAEFDLTKIVAGEEQLEKHIVVPESGKLDLSDLGAGSYRLNETKAAEGYIINSQPIYFVVNENDDENPVVDNLDFSNYQIEIVGKKIDNSGKGLEGAVYEAYRADDNNKPIGKPLAVTNSDGKETTSIVSGKEGAIKAKGFEVGHYVLIEKTAPEGYVRDQTAHPFDIKEQQGKPEPVKLADFINYQGSAKLVKMDEQGQFLAGAEFEVIDSKGNTIQSGLMTGRRGEIIVSGLKPGAYQFKETMAPIGYIRNTKPIDFKIEAAAEGSPQIVDTGRFINYQGSAALKKVDSKNKSLAGAEFKVVNDSGKTIKKKIRSDHTGAVIATGLAPGKYRFVETKAPKGYEMTSRQIAFVIDPIASGKPSAVDAGKLVNKKETTASDPAAPNSSGNGSQNHDPNDIGNSKPASHGGILPNTGDIVSLSLMLAGVVLILIIGGLTYYRKKYNKTE